jgi:hypothetical protein
MSQDFDDFEHVASPEPVRRRPALLPVLLPAVGLVALGALGFLLFVYQRSHPNGPPPAPSPTAAAATASPSPRPVPVPPLDESDPFVREIAVRLSSNPELARWLARTALVRTLTVVVSEIARGESPRLDLEFLAPPQRFRAAGGAGGRIVADPASYASYDHFGDVIASIDASAAAEAYRVTAPLFDTAARDLGHPQGFRGLLDAAIGELLEVPVPPSDAALEPHAAGFRWADPALEGLSRAQKQLARTGPRNVALVQTKLRELKAALPGGL